MRPRTWITIGAIALVAACGREERSSMPEAVEPPPQAARAEAAERIFVGGTVVTMNDEQPRAEALAVKDGRILAVGTRGAVLRHAGAATEIVEVGDRTVVPGFVESHSHLQNLGATLAMTYVSPVAPYEVDSIEEMLVELKSAEPDANGWIYGWGFDITLYQDGRVPTRVDLDQVSTDHKVYVYNLSGHAAYANTKALEEAGITRDTPDPNGGFFAKGTDGEPTGELIELAAQFSVSPPPTIDEDATMQGAWAHARAGITTATEGGMFDATAARVYTKTTAREDFPVRIVGKLAYMVPETRELIGNEATLETELYRISFAKIWVDGSIQGGTALLTEPYHDFPKANPPVPVPREELKEQVLDITRRGRELAAHCNGDQALDWALDAIEHAYSETGREDMRPMIVHGQVIRPDQFERMRLMAEKGIHVTLSLFPAHVDIWGDKHRDIFLGSERAAAMDAAASAQRAGLVYALHNDSPVSLPNPLRSMWAAVTRQTASGQVLGPEERVSAEQALAAYTRNAAWMLRMEGEVGTLEVGKRADLTVLSANPLEVEPDAIKDIEVAYTVLGGRIVEVPEAESP